MEYDRTVQDTAETVLVGWDAIMGAIGTDPANLQTDIWHRHRAKSEDGRRQYLRSM